MYVIDESDCIDGLQEAASILGKSPTAKEYSSLDVSPSMKTITTKLGSWNQAKEAAGLPERKPSYNQKKVNLGYFSEIDSPEKAYWLGFIYGDGCIREGKRSVQRFQLALAEEDRSHLKKFKETIESEHKLNEIERSGNTQDQVSLVISRREFVENLISHGADEDKTKSDSLPNLQKRSLQSPFIRGLFDADGSKSGVWKITGSNRERFKSIANWLPVPSEISSVSSEGGEWFDLRVNTCHLDELHRFLYPNGDETTPKLERKFIW